MPATGSILNYDGGIGIRGFGAPSGGRDLEQRFGSGNSGNKEH